MKKSLRTLLSMFLVFTLIFANGIIPVNAGVIYGAVDNYYDDVLNGDCEIYGNIIWTYDELNKELIVGGKGTMPDFTVGNRPWEEYADIAELVTIAGDITSVGEYAFADFSAMDVLRFMADVTVIQPYAFSDCTVLDTIHMPPSVKTIASYAFQNSTKVWAVHYEGSSSEASSINYTTNTFFEKQILL